MPDVPFSPKQKEFILCSNRQYNIAHGSVSAGKTVACIYRFIQEVVSNPGESLFIIGYSLGTIYRNVISLIMDSKELGAFRQFCTWFPGSHTLMVASKKVICLGAGDSGALGVIQGLTIDACYCDEMTLYPDNVIYMIETRLRREHSKLFASCNPKQPTHHIKQWIDRAEQNDPLYYALHFVPTDNIFLPASYIENMQKSLKGLFYKRNYLGLWCMAEGAIFDFFDPIIHTHPPYKAPAADYYIAGLDFATSSTFACVLIGVSTGKYTQTGKRMWVDREYYWDAKANNRQKTNAEFIRDLAGFTDAYPIRVFYVDPSASSFKLELRRSGVHSVDAVNDVAEGIRYMSSLMADGILTINNTCVNLVREIEGYVWDEKKAERGEDAPLKKVDHAIDAVRYAVYTHKVQDFKKSAEDMGPGRWLMRG